MAIGDITGTIDIFGLPDGMMSTNIIRVADGVCAAVHVGGFVWHGMSRNHLRSIEVENSGTINNVIDTCTYYWGGDDLRAYMVCHMRLLHISGDVFLITWSAAGGYIRTCRVLADGSVTGTISGPVSLGTNTNVLDRIATAHVAGDVYAIAHKETNTDNGVLKTVGIQDDGAITGIIDAFTFDSTYGDFPHIIHITDTVCAIAYKGPSSHGWLKTVGVQADGTITGTIGSFEFDASAATELNGVHIEGDVYALAYRGPSGHGWLKTVGIQDDGTITGTIDTFEFDASTDVHIPDMLHICDGVYAIAYQGLSSHGWLKTVGIQADGTITGTMDTLEYTTFIGGADETNIIHIADDVYAIGGTRNRITTVGITSSAARHRFTGGLLHRAFR